MTRRPIPTFGARKSPSSKGRRLLAEIIAVGSEMLTPHRSDTNSLWLSERLAEMGLWIRAKHVVGDDVDDIVTIMRQAWSRSRVLIVCGGLGPTEDDLTRNAVARLLGVPLRADRAILSRLEARFRRHRMKMPATNRRQALIPQGALPIENHAGTAPGLLARRRDRVFLALPGPPHEMRAVFTEAAERFRAALGPAAATLFVHRTILTVGLPEAAVDEMASPIYRKARGVSTTILFSGGQVELHLTAEGKDEAEAARRADALKSRLREALGDHVFGEGDTTLPQVVVEMLHDRGWRLALAESCTGGLIGHRLTQVPGASRVLDLGVVGYADWAKEEFLSVRRETLKRNGAVSEETAREMAEGARARGRATFGLAVTGIAGPDGGSEEKPVGTTFLALASGAGTRVIHLRLPGHREQVKWLASQAALNLVRLSLLRDVTAARAPAPSSAR